MRQWHSYGVFIGPLFTLVYLIMTRLQPRQDIVFQAGGPASLGFDTFLWMLAITGVALSLASAVRAASERARAESATEDELARIQARLAQCVTREEFERTTQSFLDTQPEKSPLV
jgi:hypothetical protein